MTGGASKSDDPFAGYVPVRPAVPVVDDRTLDVPQNDRRRVQKRKRKRKADGHVLRSLGHALLWVVSAALVAAIAVVSYGFIYERSDSGRAPELSSFLDRMRTLSGFGRDVRAKVGAISGLKTSGCTGDCRPDDVRSPAIVTPAVTNVVLYQGRLKAAQQVADGENVDSDGAAGDDHASAPDSRENSRPGKRTVDPRLRKFRGGDRFGRPVRLGE